MSGKFLPFPLLLVSELSDPLLRENFKRLNTLSQLPGAPLLNFVRLEIALTEEKTAFKVPHGLAYTPTDIWTTWITGPALIQFNYDLFDATNIVLSTVTGTPTRANPALLRCLVGAWDLGNT